MIAFFGCWNGLGHQLRDESGTIITSFGPFLPQTLDGTFAPTDARTGAPKITDFNGWTVLAFHDFTVDSRGGSNGAFIVEGNHTTAWIWREARRAFPHVVDRLVGHVRGAAKEQGNG